MLLDAIRAPLLVVPSAGLGTWHTGSASMNRLVLRRFGRRPRRPFVFVSLAFSLSVFFLDQERRSERRRDQDNGSERKDSQGFNLEREQG
jgi:hypothetical protein